MITRESRWESQLLFFPYHADLNLFTHSERPVLHYMKAILQEITYEKVSGGLMVEDCSPTAGDRPETLKSARRSKIKLETILWGGIRWNVIRIDLPPAGWPKSREPALTIKNQPRNPSSARKSRNAKMTQKCRTGESHGTLGQNFSKKVFEKFRKGDKGKNPELHISLHRSTLGQNFSIFKKLEKFIQRYILGQSFHFCQRKIGKIRRVIQMGLVKE